MTVELACGEIRAVVAPEQGCEFRSLTLAGEELLFQAPWPPAPVPPPPASAAAWEACWRGGWQLLAPNAGEPCTVGGRRHGFHGDSSLAGWNVLASDSSLVGRWDDPGGLQLTREIELRPDGVQASVSIVNAGELPQPLLVTEHLVLGGQLADADVTIELAGGTVVAQTWQGELDGPAALWPAGFERLAPRPLSRFAVVQDVAGRCATVRGRRLTMRLEFTHPHLWLWQEGGGAQEPPWDGRTSCLAIEPSSAPRADGLAAAIERGEAGWLAPGETRREQLRLVLA